MEVGDIVEHKCKESTSGYPHDKKYAFGGVCRMKNPTTGEWVDGAIYFNIKDGEMQEFVRELNDFNNKFKKVEHESKD